uniref:RNA-directed DNA polymerase homolog n=1 Tax=Tanacetum cinerariifolium TaxID=118510 RepID=A0A699L0U6_TANCI|nr:RNA-directed DNA polymerase homolog [Tanacetum cinerariifolium]
MVKEGIVLGHKISKKGIEVDKEKIEVISVAYRVSHERWDYHDTSNELESCEFKPAMMPAPARQLVCAIKAEM